MQGSADGGTIYWPRWTTAHQLMSRIVVARNMFTNHFPDKMYKELHRLAEALGVPPVETVFARHRAVAPVQEGPPSRSKTPDAPGTQQQRSRTPDRVSPRSRTPDRSFSTSPRRPGQL